MASYKSTVKEIEKVLASHGTKDDGYTLEELPEIIAFLAYEYDEMQLKIGRLYDILTGEDDALHTTD